MAEMALSPLLSGPCSDRASELGKKILQEKGTGREVEVVSAKEKRRN